MPKKEKSYEQLRESEAKYRNLFENANDSIYIYDSDGYFREVNNTALKLLRCTREEIIGTHISEWITPESLKNTQEILKNQKAGNRLEEPFVLEVISKKGEHLWMEIKRRLVKEGDRLIEVHGIGRDITEKMKLEKQLTEYHKKLEKSYENLKESEARYRDLFENATDAIFTSDAEGHIITANDATVRNLGCKTMDEVIGTHFSDWLTPESIQNAQNNKRKYLSGEPVKQPVVHEFIWKNGEHRWAEIISRIIKEGDKAIALHCIARDITEKRKLEQELKESEAKYRDLFENAQDAMYVIDTKGNFLKMNQIGLQILGYAREEVIGSNISKFVTSESFKIVKERQKKRLLGEIVNQKNVLEIMCKNGEHRWVEIRTRDIKDEDKIIEIHGIARDITENIILKQELKKSDNQKKLLTYLIEGTRGGKTRAFILRHLTERSYNANQLAKALNMDYKTVRHHLKVLLKKGIITRGHDEYYGLYFISKNIESDLVEMYLGDITQ
jgi:two-component system cell cycle sensor histidine kinase/response regulator CckA